MVCCTRGFGLSPTQVGLYLLPGGELGWFVIAVLGMLFIGAGVPFAIAAAAKLVVDAVKPSEAGLADRHETRPTNLAA